MSNEEIRAEVDTFLFEGHDTTASGLAWTLYNLACFTEHQQMCRNEVDSIFGEKDEIEWFVHCHWFKMLSLEPIMQYGLLSMMQYGLQAYSLSISLFGKVGNNNNIIGGGNINNNIGGNNNNIIGGW